MMLTVLRIMAFACFSLSAGAPAAAADALFDSRAALEHFDKGVQHLQKKDYKAAIREFEEASQIEPDAEAFYYLGYAYYMDGKTTNNDESRRLSMENFQKAYEIDPTYTPAKFMPVEAPALQPAVPAAPPQQPTQP